jgi:hypothetical protein
MAATKSQGRTLVLFMGGLTAACAGGAYFGSGVGKLALLVGLAMLVGAFASGIKLKALEGPTAEKKQPLGLKLVGLALALGGFLITFVGINVASATSGRLIVTLIGIAISLVGVMGVLPKASMQGAIWRA